MRLIKLLSKSTHHFYHRRYRKYPGAIFFYLYGAIISYPWILLWMFIIRQYRPSQCIFQKEVLTPLNMGDTVLKILDTLHPLSKLMCQNPCQITNRLISWDLVIFSFSKTSDTWLDIGVTVIVIYEIHTERA